MSNSRPKRTTRTIRLRTEQPTGQNSRRVTDGPAHTKTLCSKPMGPCSHSDGHDAPWLVGEAAPGEAAMVEDIVVGFDPVRGEANMRFDSQLSRMNCQTFSCRLSSGHFAGNGRMVMLAGMTKLAEMCQPAWSRINMAWAPGATAADISAR